MSVLGKWGIWIMVPQIIFGILGFWMAPFFGAAVPHKFAFFVAGIVSAAFIFITAFSKKDVGCYVSSTSLFSVFAVLSFLSSEYVWAISAVIFGLLTAFIAARDVQRKEGGRLWFFVLNASPAGAFLYLSQRLDEEREKMFRKE